MSATEWFAGLIIGPAVVLLGYWLAGWWRDR